MLTSLQKISFLIFLLIISPKLLADFPKKPINTYSSDYSQFWLFYQKEIRDDESEIIFRPFFSSYKEKKSNYNFKTFLYPLFYKESTSNWSISTFFLFFTKTTFNHIDTGYEADYVTPFFFWGRGSNKKDKYAGFFPFYGTMNSKFSWRKIRYVLFPVYASWQSKDYSAFSILWPLSLFGSSEKRKDFRILPFFSRKSFKEKYLRYSILWPFFQWGFTNLDKKEPISYFLFFPLYASKSSQYGNMKAKGFLWLPFLGSFVGYGKDERTDSVNFNLFFFLFQYGYSNDKDYRKLVFWPFYGYSNYASKKFTFITPFYASLKTNKYSLQTVSHYFIPLFYYSYKNYVSLGRTDKYYKIWPLFRWYKDKDGNLSWNSLSLFPIKSETMERNWSPFWSIIEYHKLVNGERRLHLFFRLYTQRWTKDSLYISIPLLLELAWTKDYKRIQFLYGFVGYERIKKKRKIQLLWFLKI